MLKVAICDDSEIDVEILEYLLKSLRYKMDVDVFHSGEDLLYSITEEQHSYHLYILDIEMSGMNGIKLAREIRSLDEQCFISFMTSHSQYVFDIFDIRVFDYMVKPVSRERLEKLIQRVRENLEKKGSIFCYSFHKTEYMANTNDIMYFRKDKRIVEIHFRDGHTAYTYMKIPEIMEQLNEEQFVRISYSSIINFQYALNRQGHTVEMKDGSLLGISRELLKTVKAQYLRYLCMGK